MADQSGLRGRVLEYRPALDGLRAVAVLAVLAYHAQIPLFRPGYAGVDVFFVLSGWLITRLILVERDRGTFRLRDFYRRRMVRLAPALVACVAVTTTMFTLLGDPPPLHRVLSALGYYTNIGVFFIPHDPSPLDPTWSLATEEQFYLLWPPLLLWLLRKRIPKLRIAAGVAVLPLLYVTVSQHLIGVLHWRLYNAYTPGWRTTALLAGCALALLPSLRPDLRRLATYAGAAVLVMSLYTSPSRTATMATVLLLAGLGDGYDGAVGRVLSTRPLVRIGQLSYGLYLWNIPVIDFLRLFDLPAHRTVAGVLLSVGGTFVMALLSFHLVEVPCLRRFSGRRASTEADPPPHAPQA